MAFASSSALSCAAPASESEKFRRAIFHAFAFFFSASTRDASGLPAVTMTWKSSIHLSLQTDAAPFRAAPSAALRMGLLCASDKDRNTLTRTPSFPISG
jgi:hypothetical protein